MTLAAALVCLTPWAPLDFIEARLARDFGERLVTERELQGESVALWANEQTQSWTILRLPGNGLACILGAGVGIGEAT